MKKKILLGLLMFAVFALFLFAGGTPEEESVSDHGADITVEIRHCNS